MPAHTLAAAVLGVCLALAARGFSATAAQAATADTPGSKTLLLTGENARDALGLSASQRRELDRLRERYRAMVQAALKKTASEGRKLLEDARCETDEKALALLSPEQKQKLRKIEIEILGPWVLHSPSLQKELGLTEKQKRKLAAAAERVDAYNAKLNKEVAEGKLSAHMRLQKLREYRGRQLKPLEKLLETREGP